MNGVNKPRLTPEGTSGFTSTAGIHFKPSTQGQGIALQTKLFIGGEFVAAKKGQVFDTVDPATEEVLATIHEATQEDIDDAVAAAHSAYESWSTSDGAFRRDCINRLADLFEKNAEFITEVEARDSGKPVSFAKAADIPLSIATYRYYAGWADKLTGEQIPMSSGTSKYLTYTRREPVGVCGQIIPWNFPLAMFAWKVAPALAAGCTVVIKSSEKTPLTALLMGELIRAAGIPAGVVNIVSGFGPVAGKAIAAHPLIDKVAFTGSTATARAIQHVAHATNMKRLSLELGGKSPLIICADADLEQAAAVAQKGLFLNAGQCCIASSRIFVEASVYDKFVETVAKQAAQAQLTNNQDPGCTQGPQVDEVQFKRVMGFIEQGKKEGARVVTGGSRHGERGYYVQPTVFADVSDDMVIAKEEIFGPVMSVLKFDKLEEAIRRANNTEYGLGAGVCTRDIGKALSIAHKVRAGTIYVNCYDVFDPAAPFGGFKESGIGRELGADALNLYTEKKTVVVDLAHN